VGSQAGLESDDLDEDSDSVGRDTKVWTTPKIWTRKFGHPAGPVQPGQVDQSRLDRSRSNLPSPSPSNLPSPSPSNLPSASPSPSPSSLGSGLIQFHRVRDRPLARGSARMR